MKNASPQQIIQAAIGYIGLREVKGEESEPLLKAIIDKYQGGNNDDSKVPWCSLWLMFLFDELGIERGETNGAARSWLKHGTPVEWEDLKAGDIIVFWRGSHNDNKSGHVVIFLGWNYHGNAFCISGNDNDSVGESSRTKHKFLGATRYTK